MEKKIITIVAIVFFGLFGLMVWGQSAQKNLAAEKKIETGGKSMLSVVGASGYDFGTISMKNGKVRYRFKVANSTNKDVMLKSVVTSCMCTSAYILGGAEKKGPFSMSGMGYVPPADELIKAGESREVEVEFDPNAHGPSGVGTIARVITLTDENEGVIEFNFKAEVTP
ncbi:MAG: DUF1573 domain-containing protein [Candidatus Paceibacterota bacterium]|jgi:hypothetical protein